jgi:hypothetical membrane protein
VLVACISLVSARTDRVFVIFLGLFGLGILGVGVFPGNYAGFHQIFAMLTFIAGGISAILSARILTGPFRYVAIVIGAVAFGFLVTALFSERLIDALGSGGTERWIAYPIVLWMTGFGGYLAGGVCGATP